MKWFLLVPGALVPEVLAPELSRTASTSRLSRLLAQAQLAAQHRAAKTGVGAAHWSWLARTFGLDSDPPVSAPYAWQALGGTRADGQQSWIAFCDPVHMAVSHDSAMVTDLAETPLRPDESEGLLALARDALRELSVGAASQARTDTLPRAGLRLETRGRQWFLLADVPIDLRSATLDAMLGRPAHEQMPNGADARAWRNLVNEIQMLWHASGINAAREQRGVNVANALWVHGAGSWKPLPPSTITQVRAEENGIDVAVLRGWLMAGGSNIGRDDPASMENPQGDTLSLCRVLFRSFAFQDWESWLQGLTLLEEQLERDLTAARACGAGQFELIVCGLRETHTLTIPLHSPWWSRIRVAPRSFASTLQRWFTEPEAFSEPERRR